MQLLRIRVVMISVLALGLTACMGPINKNVVTGNQAFVARDYATAFIYYRSAASFNNPPAQYALGYMYFYGLGVHADRQQAINWWTKAANWNYGPARRAMALLDRDMPVFQD